MKQLKFFLALVIAWMMTSMVVYAGDTFTRETIEGAEVRYEVRGNKKVTVRGLFHTNYDGFVTIPETVTYDGQTYDVVSIERGAFAHNYFLRGMTLPEAITEIPVGAFVGCRGLNDAGVTSILQHVKKIWRFAFHSCNELQQLVIPEGVEFIDEGAFQDCSNIFSVEIPSTVNEIVCLPGIRPFAGTNLWRAIIKSRWLIEQDFRGGDVPLVWSVFGNHVKEYYLREPIEHIGSHAFHRCSNVLKIDLPNTLTSIGVGAFEELCMKLVEIKTEVEKWCLIDFDDEEYFGYPMLTSVTSFMVPGNNGELENVVDHIRIPEGITAIKQFAFRSFEHLKEVTIPSTVISVGKMAFAGDISLGKVTCLAENPPFLNEDAFKGIPRNAILYVPAGCLDAYEHSDWNHYFGLITEPVSDGDIITVGDIAYKILSVRERRLELNAYNGSASQIVVPEMLNYKNYNYCVVSIGDEAFMNNTTMRTLTLPSSIENIGSNAFSGCTGLTTLNYEMEYVPTLGSNAFGSNLKNNCTLYVFDANIAEELTSTSNPNNWNNYFKAIQGPSEPIYVDVEAEGVTYSMPFLMLPIGNSVQLGLGDNSEDIFANAHGYKDIWPSSFEVPETITYNGTEYTVTRIASSALCTGVKEVTIPGSIKNIGSEAFSGLLTTLFLDCETPPAINSQTFSVFAQYPNVNRKLYVPKGSVEAYSEWVQYFNDVQPMGGLGWEFTAQTEEGVDMKFKVTGQDENGFFTVQTYGYSNGTRTYAAIPDNYQGAITIPDSVDYDGFTYVVNAIGEYSFDDDNNGIDLTEVTIPATIESIGDWAFYSSNPTLTRVNSFAKEPPTIGTSVFNINSYPKLFVTLGSLEAYCADDSWTANNYPDNVGYFYNEDMRSEMTLTQDIGKGIHMRFGITSKNTAMTFGDEYDYPVEEDYEEVSASIPSTITYNDKVYAVTEIGKESFSGCEELTSVLLPEGIISIGKEAFAFCQKLSSVSFQEGLKSIGESAFEGCEGLTSITLSKDLVTISDNAFSACSNLSSVSLPKSLRGIGNMAFIGCPLTSITLPDSLRSIGMASFAYCPLTSITLPESLESIGIGAFYECSSLSQVIRYSEVPPALAFMPMDEQTTMTPFTDCSEDCAMYVAYGCKDAYVNDADWVQCFGERIYDKVPVTLSSYGIGTFSSNLPLAFSDVYGITPYIVTDFSGTTLTMKRQQDVPAGTGIVIYKGDGEDDFLFNNNEQEGQTDPNADQTFYVPIELVDAEIETNMLVGCPEATRIQPTEGEMTNFVLAENPNDNTKLGFYKFETTEAGRLIPAGKAYLQIETAKANALGGIKGFSLDFGNETDAIESFTPSPSRMGEGSIFNIAGQRMSKLQKGINIVNGKKVFVK